MASNGERRNRGLGLEVVQGEGQLHLTGLLERAVIAGDGVVLQGLFQHPQHLVIPEGDPDVAAIVQEGKDDCFFRGPHGFCGSGFVAKGIVCPLYPRKEAIQLFGKVLQDGKGLGGQVKVGGGLSGGEIEFLVQNGVVYIVRIE